MLLEDNFMGDPEPEPPATVLLNSLTTENVRDHDCCSKPLYFGVTGDTAIDKQKRRKGDLNGHSS